LKNIYNDPAYTEIREKLHKRLEELRKQYGDSDALNDKFLKEYLDNQAKHS